MKKIISDKQKYYKQKCPECVITVPFKGARGNVRIWAHDEFNIDFRKDLQSAARCSMSFAATEIADFLMRIMPDLKVSFAEKPPAHTFVIALEISSLNSEADDYEISADKTCLKISGAGRTGVLYGAYHFLKMQGFRWLAPGVNNEITPSQRDNLSLPETPVREHPSFNILRGFDFEDPSNESADVLFWMSRNRLNMAGPRPQTSALARKLGMKLKIGGHIFEKILNPDRILASGKSIWNEHPEWYGLPASGQRTKELAQKNQFCISAPGLVDFLGAELIKALNGPWREADYVDIWGFDIFGNVCLCKSCTKIGNGSDANLRFLAGLRAIINKAVKDGSLNNGVRLIGCSYEGTVTIEAPTKPVPQELIKAGDLCTYYPIMRCYAHDMADAECPDNTLYRRHLLDWQKIKGDFVLMPGEYYNVSKFEDLPLLFTARMSADLPYYHRIGARALTYMHFPFVCQGPRRLNHLLYSELLWNAGVDAPAIANEYFKDAFGGHAEKIKCAYQKLEQAWVNMQQWRSWSKNSILTQLRDWDGSRPSLALHVDAHFKSVDSLIKSGEDSVRLMKSAFEIISGCLLEEKTVIKPVVSQPQALNPAELLRQNQTNSHIFLMEEDRRLIKYGIDSMSLITGCVKLHEEWRKNAGTKVDNLWIKLEKLADAMSLYYIPVSYNKRLPGIECKDALTRSQLRLPLDRVRQFFSK